ncbi:polysaccharide biosynthesis tyrosine autokinase [Fontisphaera persica]|uniref:GumC family protein n=1 Tax=Fontisphaera persica TaxID=2974023 RepID=UPI0024BF9735|nr:polysaccharide biosynthesis tyrosine autokinase [Fontisphaera persica]WCJ59679.1 polysaccharide biosynthesis tyrosine autokinase [Fontisphaera persica]
MVSPNPPPPTPHYLPPPDITAPESPSELRTIAGILADKAWLIILCVVISLMVAAYHLKNSPRLYQAVATVQVEQEEKKAVKVDPIVREDLRSSESLNTIVQKFKSRALLERVVETNRLAQNPAFVPQDGSVTRDEVVARLGNLTRAELRRGTRLIDIFAVHTDPKLAADIANALAEQYMAYDMQTVSATTKGAYSYLRDETERLKKKLEESERNLQKYREEAGIVSLQQSQDVLAPQLRELTAKVAQARSDTARLQRQYQRLLAQASNVSDLLLLPQIAAMPEVQGLRTALSKSEQDFKILSLRYKDKHPKYIDAAVQIEAMKRDLHLAATNALGRLLESIKVDIEDAKINQEGLEKELKQLEADALRVSQHAIQYSLLSRELEADRALFDSVLNRLKETSLAAEQQPEKLRFIQPAVPPTQPFLPRVQRTYSFALLIGLAVGLALAFGSNAMDTSFKSVEQAEAYLQLPVFTAIPKLKEVRLGDTRFVAIEGSDSRGAEAFRTLRTSVLMLEREEERKVFLFTSAFPGEGKTFSSINFAISLAQQGLRVLLIDADLRKPSVENYITGQTSKLSGLTDVLAGNRSFHEVIQTVEKVKNLHWMAGGKPAPNPAELLATPAFRQVIKHAVDNYDRVVLDTAPIHAVSDTLLICNLAETAILVVNSTKTPRKPVARSIQLIRNAGGNPSGVVLNLVPIRRGGGYYYDSFYYYHSGYYDQKKARESSEASTSDVAAGKQSKEETTASPAK